MPTTRPQIDDGFWFAFSKQWIEESTTRGDEAAQRMATLLVWLWGVYTAAIAVGAALTEYDYPLLVTVLLVAPVPMLILAYACATWAMQPRRSKFDPRMPSQIREAWSAKVRATALRLTLSMGLTFIAALLVSTALVAASVVDAKATGPELNAVAEIEGKSTRLAIGGRFPPRTIVLLVVTPTVEPEATSEPVIARYLTNSEGALSQTMTLGGHVEKVIVEARWNDPQNKGVGHAFSREFTFQLAD